MRTFFYGPPGVGKSTLVEALGGIDLERSKKGSAERAEQLRRVALLASTTVGTADEQVETLRAAFPRDHHVLLLPPRRVYDARRASRDAARPEKAAQGDYYDNFLGARMQYDAIWSNWDLPQDDG